MTLADLRQMAQLLPAGASVTLPRDALLEALAAMTEPEAAAPAEPEQWLTAEECAALLHVSPRWCYDHGAQLGAKRLSRRCVRFSSRAVARCLTRRSA